MSRIKVQCVVPTYQLDGEDNSLRYDAPHPNVIVSADPIFQGRVRLTIDLDDGTVGHEVTVYASDLVVALRNAENAE